MQVSHYGEVNDPLVKSFRLFFWGLPSPSGKTYTKEVAEKIVDAINSGGLLASFSPQLNIHLVVGYVTNAEIKGNVVYADIGLLDDLKTDVPNWADGDYRATVVLKTKDDSKQQIGGDDITQVSHVLIYR